MVATPLDGRCYMVRGPVLLYRYIPAMVKLRVTMPDVALLVTEYWYTPGSPPVTVSVLRYRLF